MMRWSAAEDALVAAHYPGSTAQELADTVLPGRSALAIRQRAAKLGLARPQEWTISEIDILCAHYLTHTAEELADTVLLGRSAKAILDRASIIGLSKQRHVPLSADELGLIVKMARRKGGIKQLAELTKRTPKRLRAIAGYYGIKRNRAGAGGGFEGK